MQNRNLFSYKSALKLILCATALSGCTRTCVGLPELGSKSHPVKFYMDGWSGDSLEPFQALTACLENNAGYRVNFEIAADEKSVSSALSRGEADLGFMSALGYVEAMSRFVVDPLLVVTQNGAPSTRSVILGKAARWKTSLQTLGIALSPSGLKREDAFAPLENGRIVYLSPSSDVGFFVPRHLLLQKNIFPDEAIFAGNYQLVLQSLEKDIGMAGAVSEAFIESSWPNSTPVQLGSIVGNFVVLGVSQPLPGKVIASRPGIQSKLSASIAQGLKDCVRLGTDVEEIFGGDGFAAATDRMFEFIREIHDFQNEHPRVLSTNDESEN